MKKLVRFIRRMRLEMSELLTEDSDIPEPMPNCLATV
jgi:hypothetical protein